MSNPKLPQFFFLAFNRSAISLASAQLVRLKCACDSLATLGGRKWAPCPHSCLCLCAGDFLPLLGSRLRGFKKSGKRKTYLLEIIINIFELIQMRILNVKLFGRTRSVLKQQVLGLRIKTNINLKNVKVERMQCSFFFPRVTYAAKCS